MSEPAVVNGSDSLLAWQAGCRHLRAHGCEAYHLVTRVTNPVLFRPEWLKDYNPRTYDASASNISDVVNTIFPRKHLESSLDEICACYERAHARKAGCGHSINHRWGTYFHRMIAYGADSEGNNGKNQLGEVIRVLGGLGGWKATPKAAAKMVISLPQTDSTRFMGGPCLQYVQFLCPSPDIVDMFAVYRNHDFFGKALGNFIGLGFLLQYVCKHTNRNPGTLTCHSAHADIYNYPRGEFVRLAQIE